MSKKTKKDITRVRHTVFCCHGSDCSKNGARDTCKALRAAVRDAGLKNEVHIIKSECTGPCKQGPMVLVCGAQGVVWYRKMRPKDAAHLVKEHLAAGSIVEAKQFWHRPYLDEITEDDDWAD